MAVKLRSVEDINEQIKKLQQERREVQKAAREADREYREKSKALMGEVFASALPDWKAVDWKALAKFAEDHSAELASCSIGRERELAEATEAFDAFCSTWRACVRRRAGKTADEPAALEPPAPQPPAPSERPQEPEVRTNPAQVPGLWGKRS